MTDQEYCMFSQYLLLVELEIKMLKKPNRTQTARQILVHEKLRIEALWARLRMLKNAGILNKEKSDED